MLRQKFVNDLSNRTIEKGEIFFSVITPVYNCCKYLEEAVYSVINQTFSNWELIIIDDGSTDNSLSLAKSLEAKDSRIRVLQHSTGTNIGVSASRNLGMKSATGKWIALLDADDIWVKHKLEKEYSVISANDDLVLVYSNAIIFSSGNKTRKSNTVYGSGIKGKVTDPFRKLIEGFHIPASGLSFRKEILAVTGGFNENIRFAEDTLLIHQILETGSIYYIDEVLGTFRFHDTSSSKLTADIDKIAARYKVYCLLLDFVKEANIKIVSLALVKVGFKKILRNYFVIPHCNLTVVGFYLKDLLGNRKITMAGKALAILLVIAEFLFIPFRFVFSKI